MIETHPFSTMKRLDQCMCMSSDDVTEGSPAGAPSAVLGVSKTGRTKYQTLSSPRMPLSCPPPPGLPHLPPQGAGEQRKLHPVNELTGENSQLSKTSAATFPLSFVTTIPLHLPIPVMVGGAPGSPPPPKQTKGQADCPKTMYYTNNKKYTF